MITEELRSTFAELTAGGMPYAYQVRTGEALTRGTNVLLRAPTGAGKTLAALLPFLATRRKGSPFVDRVIYALPLRTLATSLWQSTRQSAQRAGWSHSDQPPTAGRGPQLHTLHITLQTGEQQDDPYFLGDVVFTTIDQLLSGYLNIPVSLPQRSGNMTAGALTGALVVLDEVHLLEVGKSLATAVEMARRLRDLTQCLWMTATISEEAAGILSAALNAERIDVPVAERIKMPAQRDKERRWHWTGRELDANQVLTRHSGGRTIALCNTVGRAQQLFSRILERKAPATQVYLLHSRFFARDRKSTEDRLDALFGPRATERDAILISTQVVEAGIDISADVLHSELCPANALLQRAGRCARYAGDRSKGTVYVYEIPSNHPYLDNDQTKAIEATREALIQLDGRILDSDEEQRLVDSVHGSSDAQRLREVCERERTQHANSVTQAMNSGEGARIRDLIRDVDSLSLILHAAPERDLPNLRSVPEAISVPRYSLFSLLPAFETVAEGTPVAWVPEDVEGEAEQQGGTSIRWRPVDFGKLRSAPYLAVIHPRLASYSSTIGLQLRVPDTVAPPLRYPTRAAAVYGDMCCETWLEHAARTLAEGRDLRSRASVACRRLDQMLGAREGTVKWLCDLACVLHDTGKLRADWQRRIRAWQQYKNPAAAPFITGEPLAHSDFAWRSDRYASRQPPYGPLPVHSLEGAFAVAGAIVEACRERISDAVTAESCARAVVSSIARHHGAYAHDLKSFTLISGADAIVRRSALLADPGQRCAWRTEHDPDIVDCVGFGRDWLVMAEEEPVYHLYRFIVRYLRLADTRSLESKAGRNLEP